MDHLTQPLERLFSRAVTFVADTGARFLHVVADDALYADAVKTVMSTEWVPQNRQHFALVTPQIAAGAIDWQHADTSLRDGYDQIRARYLQGGIELATLATFKGDGTPIVRFAAVVRQVGDHLSTRPAPTEGITIVLALEQALLRLAEDLQALVDAPSLRAGVRWIVVERGGSQAAVVATRLAAAAFGVRCEVDPIRQREEIDDLLAALARPPTDSRAPGNPAGARPQVPPPARASGKVPPLATSDHSPHFTAAVLEGVLALRRGDLATAIRYQRRARDACNTTGKTVEAVEMQILLAVYAAQLCLAQGVPVRPAMEEFDLAIADAERAGLPVLAARASILRGTVANVAGDAPAAAQAFRRAATWAEAGGVGALQAAALNLAGDLVQRAGMNTRAGELRAEADRAEAPDPTDKSTRVTGEGSG